MAEPHEMTAAELSRAFHDGDLSPVEATDACLARIEALDSEINAFCLIDEQTSRAQAEASEKRWAEGDPLSPLDGGRITAILSPRIWLLGAPMMLALMLYRPSPLLILIAIMSVPSPQRAWKYNAKAPENVAYYGVPMELKIEYGCFYLGLAAFLAIMTESVYGMLNGAR